MSAMKHCKTMLSTRLTLTCLVAGAIVPLVQAQSVSSVHFVGTRWHDDSTNPPYSGLNLGILRNEGQYADTKGGYLFLRILGDQLGCPGATQKFKFSWTFTPDVTQINVGDAPVQVKFNIDLLESNPLGPNGRVCLHENPGMTVNAQSNFGERPGYGASFYYDPTRSGITNYPNPHLVWLNPGGFQTGFFQIVMTYLGEPTIGFETHVDYNYQGGAAPPAPSAQQILINWAAGTGLFGSPVGAFYTYSSWSPGWTLSYMDFAYSYGRQVRIYLATSQTDPNQRFVIFWDPDAQQWVGWTPVS